MQTLISEPIVNQIKLVTTQEVDRLIASGSEPHLAVILVGEHPASLRYVSLKSEAAKSQGIIVSVYHLEEDIPFEEIVQALQFLNDDPEVHGIIVQLPLPERFTNQQTETLLGSIAQSKDVDGLTGVWQEKIPSITDFQELLIFRPLALPPMICTVLSLLSHYHLPLENQKIVLIGKGRLVGQPLLTYFQALGLEVEAVDETTDHILDVCKTADILITGTGEPDLVTYQWVKEGAVVINCANDVHIDSVSQVASAMSPAKGGVGPLTVQWLLFNTVQAAHNQTLL